jgi:phosphatidate cytidylyltransferase
VAGGLATRAIVGVFLAVSALAGVALGGWAFDLLVIAGVALVFREWSLMHGVGNDWQVAGIGLLVTVGLLSHFGAAGAALALLLAGLVLAFGWMLARPAAAHGMKRFVTTGLLYAGLPAIALVWLRQQADGFHLVVWTMAIVWATDTFAYFAGRAIGGPKLWPAVSPNKTWAGLFGGVAAASVASAALGAAFGWASGMALLAAMGAALALVAQGGDLLESHLKRRAGVKDSGRLLPGHGGIMDRVDGLVPVACLVALGVSFA